MSDRQDGPALPTTEPLMAALAAWSRPSLRGSDRAMSGAGSPPPALSAADVIELRAVTNTAIEHIGDVSEMLTDALSARPGVLAQITAAVGTLRLAATQLETFIRRGPDELRSRESDPAP